MEMKYETFVYEGLGFPIKIIECPMRKWGDEWLIDINMGALQRFMCEKLTQRPFLLTEKRFVFLKKFLELSTEEVEEKIGLSFDSLVGKKDIPFQVLPNELEDFELRPRTAVR